jgi:cytochrome c-type biogenesis protein
MSVEAQHTAPLLYAFTLGLVGAVNPCGFPLLPAYLVASAAEAETLPLHRRLLRGLHSGVAVTIGALVVFAAAGAAAQAGVTVAQRWAPWVMVAVGAVCCAIGAWALAGRALPSWSVQRWVGRSRGRFTAFCSFGVVYALASLSCELPVFVAALAPLFAGGRVALGGAAGGAYGLGMGLVVCAVSLVGVGARPLRLGRVRALQPAMERIAGAVLVLVGGYLVAYWVSDLTDPLHPPSVVRWVESVQGDLSAWLAGSPRLVGLVLGAAIVAALVGAALAGRRGESGPVPPVELAPPPRAVAGVAGREDPR